MTPKPTLHSHKITQGLIIFNGVREPLGGLPSRTKDSETHDKRQNQQFSFINQNNLIA